MPLTFEVPRITAMMMANPILRRRMPEVLVVPVPDPRNSYSTRTHTAVPAGGLLL